MLAPTTCLSPPTQLSVIHHLTQQDPNGSFIRSHNHRMAVPSQSTMSTSSDNFHSILSDLSPKRLTGERSEIRMDLRHGHCFESVYSDRVHL